MSSRHKHVILPPDNISDWFKIPVLEMRFYMADAFNNWLFDETTGRFYYTHTHIYFEHEDDAIMYSLRWM